MLRKHSNALQQFIKDAGLDEQRFRSKNEDIDGYKATRIYVGDSSLYFVIRTRYTGEAREFSLSLTQYQRAHPNPKYPYQGFGDWTSFAKATEMFTNWLKWHASDFLADQDEETSDQLLPDLWAAPNSLLTLESDPEFEANRPFSKSEQQRIAETLDMLANTLHTDQVVNEEQVAELRQRLDYLVESSNRLGRKDWLLTAAGTIMGFTLQAGLSSEAAVHVLKLAGAVLKWITNVPVLLP